MPLLCSWPYSSVHLPTAKGRKPRRSLGSPMFTTRDCIRNHGTRYNPQASITALTTPLAFDCRPTRYSLKIFLDRDSGLADYGTAWHTSQQKNLTLDTTSGFEIATDMLTL